MDCWTFVVGHLARGMGTQVHAQSLLPLQRSYDEFHQYGRGVDRTGIERDLHQTRYGQTKMGLEGVVGHGPEEDWMEMALVLNLGGPSMTRPWIPRILRTMLTRRRLGSKLSNAWCSHVRLIWRHVDRCVFDGGDGIW